jgi:hypothetical protein
VIEVDAMRKMILLLTFLGVVAVYEPNSIIPKYYVDKTPQGEYRVYDSKQVVVPKYIVKPDHSGNGYKVYPAGKPVLPLYRIERRQGKHR